METPTREARRIDLADIDFSELDREDPTLADGSQRVDS